eukprot:UN10218
MISLNNKIDKSSSSRSTKIKADNKRVSTKNRKFAKGASKANMMQNVASSSSKFKISRRDWASLTPININAKGRSSTSKRRRKHSAPHAMPRAKSAGRKSSLGGSKTPKSPLKMTSEQKELLIAQRLDFISTTS